MKKTLRLISKLQESQSLSDSEPIHVEIVLPNKKIEEYNESLCKIGFSLPEKHKSSDLGIPDYFTSEKLENKPQSEPVNTLNAKLPLMCSPEPKPQIDRPDDFNFWTEALLQGLNILLFGAGSKLHILDGYQSHLISQSLNLIRVNAFNPVITMRKILNEILVFLGEEAITYTNLDRLLSTVLSRLDNEASIFLLIDNIDSKAFIEVESQTILSRLSSHPSLHLIASLDNPYLLYRWSIDANMKYNFLYIPCVSLNDYTTELMYLDGLKFFDQSTTFSQMRAIEFVLRSLTVNQRKILKELCYAIIKNPNGIPFKEFLDICIEETLVINSKQLKDALVEALDHQIAVYKQGSHGELLILLKLDPVILSNKISA